MKTLRARIICNAIIYTEFRQKVPDGTTPAEFAAVVQRGLDDGTLYGFAGWLPRWEMDLEGSHSDRVEAVKDESGHETPIENQTLEEKILAGYRQLHDGLSDMVEGGRIKEGDIPEDYQWLVKKLAELAGLDPGVPTTAEERQDELRELFD